MSDIYNENRHPGRRKEDKHPPPKVKIEHHWHVRICNNNIFVNHKLDPSKIPPLPTGGDEGGNSAS